MELTLLGTVAVAAFLLVGACIMLVVSFRRTIELRGALIQSLRRIEKLEAAILQGQPVHIVLPGSAPADAIAAPEHAPRLLPPTVDELAAEADARDRIDPPHLGVVSLVAGLAAFSALGAAQTGALSGGAGLIIAILVGLAVLVSAEWRRRTDVQGEPARLLAPRQSTLAALLALAIIAAALLYARYPLMALHPHNAVAGMALLALLAAALSHWHGAWLIGAALFCAAIAPGLSPIGAAGAWGQYLFLAGFFGLVLLLSRRAGAPIWAWLAAAIALFWGFNAAWIGGGGFNLGVAGLYLALVAALGLFYAWRAGVALPYPRFWAAAWREPLLLGMSVLTLCGVGLTVLLLRNGPELNFGGPALLAFAVVANAAAALRPGLWPASFLAALACAAALAFYPSSLPLAREAPALLTLAGGLGLVFSFGGVAALLQNDDARPGAALAGLATVLIFAAAYWRIGDYGGAQAWATAAMALAALNGAAHLHFRRAGSPAASAFAAGAALAFAAAMIAIAPAPYQPLALAACLPIIAAIERWRDNPGLRLAVIVLCGSLCALLLLPPILGIAAPLWQVAALFAPGAAAALIASFIFARGETQHDRAAAAQTFAVALFIAAAGASLTARHVFTGGALYAPYTSLAEAGINTSVWLGFSLILAWSSAWTPARALGALETLAFVGAIVHALTMQGIWINPWWGYAPAPVSGPEGLNTIALAFAAPALLLSLYAIVRTRQGKHARAGVAIAAASALAFLNLLLELRRLFHGAAMANAPVTQYEAWTYSVALLGFAALLLALAAKRQGIMLRLASLVLALTALTKMAFSDLGALDGAVRIVAFVLIALAAGGVVFFFRRFVLPPTARQPKTMAETNFAPPSPP